MDKQKQKVLAAALAGLIVAGAAGLAVQPAMASGYPVEHLAKVSNVAWWDALNVRKWPASYSQKIGALPPGTHVWVERCNVIANSSDWCLVERGALKGWVNSRYLELAFDTDI